MLTKPCLVATHFATRFQSTHFPSKKKDQQRALVIQLPGNSDHLHESLAAHIKGDSLKNPLKYGNGMGSL